MKDKHYATLLKLLSEKKEKEQRAPFTTKAEFMKYAGVSNSTAYRTLEKAVKEMLLFRVQTVRGTFTTNHYFQSCEFIKMGGMLPITHRKLVRGMIMLKEIEGKENDYVLPEVTQSHVKEVYENWSAS